MVLLRSSLLDRSTYAASFHASLAIYFSPDNDHLQAVSNSSQWCDEEPQYSFIHSRRQQFEDFKFFYVGNICALFYTRNTLQFSPAQHFKCAPFLVSWQGPCFITGLRKQHYLQTKPLVWPSFDLDNLRTPSLSWKI